MPKVGKARKRCFAGIDPGASGGIAAVHEDGKVLAALPMPETMCDVWTAVAELTLFNPEFAVIEKVQGYIGVSQPGSAMFKFGQSSGALLMALTAAEIPFSEPTPQRWQKGLGIPGRKKDEPKSKWKARLRDVAQRLFPKWKPTLKTCDAILMAEYCRRERMGLLSKERPLRRTLKRRKTS